MSWKVEQWVYDHSMLKGAAHRLLLAIAFSAHEDGTGAYPSISTLAHRVRTTPRAVQQLLPKLVESGELIIHYRKGPRQVNKYVVVMKPRSDGGKLPSEHPTNYEFGDAHSDENFTSSGEENFTTQNVHGELFDRPAAMKASPPAAMKASPLEVQKTSPPTAMRTSPPAAMRTSPKQSRNGPEPSRNCPGKEKETQQNVNKPLPQPGENGCLKPGGNGRSSSGQRSSVFPGVITKGVSETEDTDIGPALPDPYQAYQRNIGPLVPMLEESIRAAAERYGAASIVEAIGIAVQQNSRKWSYVEGILRKWGSEGRGALGVSTDQRNNRTKYLEEYVRVRGRLPWESASEDDQRDFHREQERRRAPPAEADPEAQGIWSTVLEDMAQVVDKPTFQTWLAETRGFGCDDRRFVVEVPTPFAIAWLERRMYQDLQKKLQKVTGKLLDIQFQCSS